MFGTTCDSSTTTCPTSGTANVEGANSDILGKRYKYRNYYINNY